MRPRALPKTQAVSTLLIEKSLELILLGLTVLLLLPFAVLPPNTEQVGLLLAGVATWVFITVISLNGYMAVWLTPEWPAFNDASKQFTGVMAGRQQGAPEGRHVGRGQTQPIHQHLVIGQRDGNFHQSFGQQIGQNRRAARVQRAIEIEHGLDDRRCELFWRQDGPQGAGAAVVGEALGKQQAQQIMIPAQIGRPEADGRHVMLCEGLARSDHLIALAGR